MRRLADLVTRWPLAVIGLWVAVAVLLPLALPTLNEMAQRHPLAVLPSDAPSNMAARQMAEVFHEAGTDNLLLVALINEDGLRPADEAAYRGLVDALRDNLTDVVMLQEFVSTPQLRPVLTSQDKTTWVLPVGLAGELGTPQAYGAYNRVSDIVRHNVDGSELEVYLAGPAATVADLTVSGQQDRLPIELAIGGLVLVVLLVVYRNPITMLLPLASIGISLVTAHTVVAGLSLLTGMGVSNQSIIFMTAMIAGAGTDYAVFLISRYHDYLRRGADAEEALRRALISIGKVITASAATVGITFLGISFAKMGVFSTIGASSAMGIGVAYLAALTLLPAILILAGQRGWVQPRRELTARFWRRSGIRIVRRPKVHLVASVLVLVVLASCAAMVQYNYDDREALGPSMPSSAGYAALGQHFNVSRAIPTYVLVQSPRDLVTPQSLADLEQMAQRISQLPDIALISGATRPMGFVPQEFRATYQAGVVGHRLAAGSAQISDNTGEFGRLVTGANTLADSLGEVRAHIGQIAPSLQALINSFSSMKSEYGGDRLVRDVDIAAQLVHSVNSLGNAIGLNFTTVTDLFTWVGPVLTALRGNAICDANPSCSNTRRQFEKLVAAENDGSVDHINQLAQQLQGFEDRQTLNSAVNQLNTTLAKLQDVVRSMGLDRAGGFESGVAGLRQSAERLADGSQEVASGVDHLVAQIELMGTGLREASAFLLTMSNDASDPAMAGFNVPTSILNLDEFKKATQMFVSPDGHSVRYLVQTELDPFSADAMDQVNAIADIARGAKANTTLADASISIAGFPASLRDTRDYYEQDIRFIIAVTLFVVLLTLMVLLRAVVAPLYLVTSVVLSYFAAIGLSVLLFQHLLDQQLHWSVPPLAFVVLVAVGADYNLLFVSRMRDESPDGMRYGVIRTLTSTGGVITAAGLIFAASMGGLMFSSISTVVQGGFVIGVGVLLDTFLVRTITVPAVATLVGRANWWPSRLGARPPVAQSSVGQATGAPR